MKKFINHLTSIIILTGIFIVSYPAISQIYYNYINQQTISDFDSGKKNLTSAEIQERMTLAEAYNHSLQNVEISDPYTQEQLDAGRTEYARMLTVHEKIGTISIPSIDVDLPIYAGSSEEVLQKGVGHLEGTSLPVGGESTHTVITAHRGLPSARLFTDLDKVKVGDIFYITNIKETLAYKVDQILTVEPDNFDPVLVSQGHDYATLLTCTPYMINSHRLLVRGERIALPEKEEKKAKKINRYKKYYWFIISAGLVLLILLCYLTYRFIKRKRK